MQLQKSLPSPNNVLLVGGIIAGAYIVYKFAQGAGKLTDTVNSALDSVKNGITDIAEKAKNVIPQNAATVSKTVVTSDPMSSIFGGGIGLNSPITFTGVSTSDPYDPTSPLYTSGQVYSHVTYNPIIDNRVDNPFSFL